MIAKGRKAAIVWRFDRRDTGDLKPISIFRPVITKLPVSQADNLTVNEVIFSVENDAPNNLQNYSYTGLSHLNMSGSSSQSGNSLAVLCPA
jgi:hypothetical protein